MIIRPVVWLDQDHRFYRVVTQHDHLGWHWQIRHARPSRDGLSVGELVTRPDGRGYSGWAPGWRVGMWRCDRAIRRHLTLG